MNQVLKNEVDDMLFIEEDLLHEAFDMSNPVVRQLEDVLGLEAYDELRTAVNLAILQASRAGFVAGIQFMQNPASFMLKDER